MRSRCADTSGACTLYSSSCQCALVIDFTHDARSACVISVAHCCPSMLLLTAHVHCMSSGLFPQVKGLLATADEAGSVLIFRISSTPETVDTDTGDSREHCRYEAGFPNIYRPVARCSSVPADGHALVRANGMARLVWVGSVLYTASDAGVVHRWAMEL